MKLGICCRDGGLAQAATALMLHAPRRSLHTSPMLSAFAAVDRARPGERRAAVESVIGHLKAEHRMGRNYLKEPDGDRINAVLAGAGYNFGLLLRWLAELLRALFLALAQTAPPAQTF